MTEFHIVAGTGRMGTSYVASFLNRIDGVLGLHEGHLGVDEGADVLPMVNLQHLTAYRSEDDARQVVSNLRSSKQINDAGLTFQAKAIVDVAYYNAILSSAICEAHSTARMVAIIRDCESFVRSATWLTGTDPMPVGWPAPEKQLDSRERFISMGRIRPLHGESAEKWSQWSAISRNIWLWQETNHILLDTVSRYRDRSLVMDFSDFVANTEAAMKTIAMWLMPDIISETLSDGRWPSDVDEHSTRQNSRVGGYQVGPQADWTAGEKELFESAVQSINQQLEVVGGFS